MTLSWLRLGGFALVGGCGLSAAFPCDVDADCIDGGRLGLCQPDGWCSFPDEGCGSGQRYGTHAGDGLAGLCVDEPGTTGAIETGAVEGEATAADSNDPSLTTLEATGPVDAGGDTSTSGIDDGTTSGATVVTSISDSATLEGPPPDGGGSEGSTAICGNGIIDEGEACDGQDVGNQDCASLGAGSGVLVCSPSCELDLSMCVPDDGGTDYVPCMLATDCETMICHVFAGNGTCLPPCQVDDECPNLLGAEDPECTIDGFCVLPCGGQNDCPAPMRCDDSMYGSVCLW